MRIAGFCKHGTANAYYRCMLPLAELERRGHEVVLFNSAAFPDGRAGVPNWDVVHLQQVWDEADLQLVRSLAERGIGVVWDTDDDISAIPRNSFARYQLGGRRGVKRTFDRSVEIARAAHVMTTPSAHIAQLYRGHGAEHVTVIENYLAPDDVRRRRRRHQGIVIGCTAAGEHRADLRGLGLHKTLKKILETHADVRVFALGHDLRLDHPRYTFHRHVPVGELIALESEFDIGIAPLEDTPLNRARSNVKLKEYAAAGATWLASSVGPYVGMGAAEGGQLVADRDWFDALDAIVTDQDRRFVLRAKAKEWVAAHSISAAGRAWEATIREAVRRARAGAAVA